MSQYFIYNDSTDNLASVISQILPSKTQSMDFLVGYFYFSGIKEIHQHIKDKPMRILVGMDMEQDLRSRTAEFNFFAQQKAVSRQESKQAFYSSLVRLFNESDYFESDEEAEAFRIYFEKIKNGTLEIRKTKEPCHAKLYIFSYTEAFSENGALPGTVITGSSNLTYRGLRANNEINVRFHSKAEYDDAEEIFNRLWSDAIVIADKDTIQDFEDNVVEHIWFDKIPSPYLLYLRVLYEYFHIDDSRHIATPSEITRGNFRDLRYQVDAIRMALDVIDRHNGVIVADVVGLGKSIIGSAVANNLHMRTIVVAPPHLTAQWEDYRSEFNFNARVFSRGNMDKILDYYRTARREGEQWLIIVDEAHAYRNEYIRDYALLHELCMGNKVMLLTATPFNNRPADIYAMIKLFQNPTKSTLQTVNNLGAEFASLIYRYKQLSTKQRNHTIGAEELKASIETVAAEIRRIIGPLVIRRSRLDLLKIDAYRKDMEQQQMEFSVPQPPTIIDYPLGDLEELYRYTLARISPREDDKRLIDERDFDPEAEQDEPHTAQATFQAARYKPLLYVKVDAKEKVKHLIEEAGLEYNLFLGSQRNLAAFMRTMLVHRFESSQKAFRQSLDNMLSYCNNIKHWMELRGKVPVYKKGYLPDVAEMYDAAEDTIDPMHEVETQIEALHSKGMFEVPVEYLADDFAADLEADIALLADLKQRWDAIPLENDPKLTEFIAILQRQLRDDPLRKIIVFSQFADTVEYLGEKLKETGLPVMAYTSKQATARNKEFIRQNFDAGFPTSKRLNVCSILVATDAISEGYNLHRAGTIFNYDIPYNPTRIIQRVGRINRINKKVFDRLYIYNYFPTAIGEKETRTKEITTLKMAMIHAIMGEDTQYLTDEEQLNSFFEQQWGEMLAQQENESWDTPYRAMLGELEHSSAMAEALQLPLRSKIRRLTTTADTGIVAFARKGGDYVFKFYTDGGAPTDISAEQGLDILRAEPAEQGHKLSPEFAAQFAELKTSLFAQENEGEKDKTKRDAVDKVRLIMQSRTVDRDYLEDLLSAIRHDSIPGYSLRAINRLKPSEYASLPDIIGRDYITSALHTYADVDSTAETLIIAEELHNIISNPQTTIEL